jgi:hypothetical protein
LTWATPADPKPAPSAAKPSGPSASDAALQQIIQEKFSRSKAGGGKFQVKVQSGVAYLSGRADVVQHKGSATRMARTAGAKQVVNNIVVSEAGRQRAARALEKGRSVGEKPRRAALKP